jgi:hypothetical protein
MAWKAPKVKIDVPKASGLDLDRNSPFKGVSDVVASMDVTNPQSVYRKGAIKGEELFGGRKKKSTKEAEEAQDTAVEDNYRETGGVLDTMKGSDDTFVKDTESAQGSYTKDRDAGMSKYSQEEEASSNEYKTRRNSADTKNLEGDAAATKAYRERRGNIDKEQLAGDEAATNKYRSARNPIYEKYQGQLKSLSDDAAAQASDGTKTYKNNIQPRLQNIMSDAETQAGSAMSLADAGDPNNKVNKAWNDLYEAKAQGVNKQALNNVGVMNALGSQATANQLGGMGGAVSTNALLALQGQNMSQSGQAFARAQQQMQSLREQGLDVGRAESANQYNRGQAAKDRYGASVRDFADADSAYQGRMAGYRGEQGGYASKGFETGRQLAGEDYDIDQDRVGLVSQLGRGAAGEDYGIDKDRVGLESRLSKGAAGEDYDISQRLSKQNYDMGDRRNTENLGMSTGLAGMRHSLSADQAGRQLSNINQKYGKQEINAGTRANVGYQQQIQGPALGASIAGAGVKAAAASSGSPAAAGAATAAAPTAEAGNYAPAPNPYAPQPNQSYAPDPKQRRRYGDYG